MKIQETTNGQLVAHCMFAYGKPRVYENYADYYNNPKDKTKEYIGEN